MFEFLFGLQWVIILGLIFWALASRDKAEAMHQNWLAELRMNEEKEANLKKAMAVVGLELQLLQGNTQHLKHEVQADQEAIRQIGKRWLSGPLFDHAAIAERLADGDAPSDVLKFLKGGK